MTMWQLLTIIGITFLVLEMFTPAMFFLNFAIAAFLTSYISLFITNLNILMIIFVTLSLLLLLFLRPVLMKNKTSKKQETGMKSKYVDKTARVIKTVTPSSGTISIYDERWEARTLNGEEIPVDSIVKIIKYDSLTMFVSKNN